MKFCNWNITIVKHEQARPGTRWRWRRVGLGGFFHRAADLDPVARSANSRASWANCGDPGGDVRLRRPIDVGAHGDVVSRLRRRKNRFPIDRRTACRTVTAAVARMVTDMSPIPRSPRGRRPRHHFDLLDAVAQGCDRRAGHQHLQRLARPAASVQETARSWSSTGGPTASRSSRDADRARPDRRA